MAIRVTEQGRNFYLETLHSMYQIKADEYGVLKHIWYGSRTECDMEYLLDYPDLGFSGNIYEAENKRDYSLDTMPLEYSCKGIGDHRIPAAAITHPNGSDALDLRFDGYEIKKGKYVISGLPAVYADEDEAETLEIYLKDTSSDIRVILKYGVLEKKDIITRSAVFCNMGDAPCKITKAFSLCLDIPHGDWDWVHFHGRHIMERLVERRSLFHGVQESSSNRGTSSHQQNPSVLLCSNDCTETSGECIGALLVYSGSFQTKIELTQLNQVRMLMGINSECFSWELKPNEQFSTPEVILSYSDSGMETLSHNFHNVIRNNICRGEYKQSERPVLINNWEATYFDFNEERLENIAKEASKLGVDMFVMDDGWFGKRDSDTSGLGDWFVNEEKLKGGLNTLVEKVKSYGMKFGIWFEPEMVSEDSELYRTHPEWAIQIPNRKPTRSRYQLVLDMTRQDVRDYLFKVISDVLSSADISYVKWDMNRSICDWYSAELPVENMGEMQHRYVLGLYELLDRLTSEFPHILFEGCSGGGGRFDAGILYYCPQIWCSDDTDAYERTKIQYGTSFFYPISTIGSHVSIVPNHQTGRITPFETRAVTAMSGSFGYELDLNTLSEEEKNAVIEQNKRFKKYGPLIHNGRYYRLSNPMTDKFAIWSFVSENSGEVLVHGMIFRTEPNMTRYSVKLRGLISNKKYVVDGDNTIYTGKALMEGGILLPKPWGDFFPIELHLKEV
ncbi:alpha-galactosidase [Eubacterium sp. OM08-24]|uniref:alpha-galactosidase n=1 Tax=Eubacterium sp. OM08-24 TaxID=2292352 RepID=UPI000E440D68|nr:alpha-galactosidase [Eubacterium sp. OM08-24]RGM22052.1 alpha-galactosidase [Eubacterium sp. OM08-24]